jgi:hypothetical protein
MQNSAAMTRFAKQALAVAALSAAITGCGERSPSAPSSTTSHVTSTPGDPVPQGQPQAVEPVAGVGSASAANAGGAEGSVTVGDANAHAPPLSQIKQELRQLNLCGGLSTGSGNASPLVGASGPGFVADPGTSQTEGQLPTLTARLDALGKALGVTIYGISGYRTPAHSVAVGGYADDPHTKGLAEDIGVNSLLRSSAAQISEAELAKFGLYRPFDPSDDPNNPEVNHIQLIPSGGPVPLPQVTAAWNPDPRCR